MPEPQERERTTVVTSGNGGGAIWFVVGALVVVAIVAVWLFAGGAIDGTQTSDVNVDLPDNVDVQVDRSEPAPAETESVPTEPAPAEPAPEQAPAPSE